jgi:non-ribosomal peptide synthetase component F/aryl carrier-like protein
MDNRKNIEDIYPLSPTQQGMLFHTLYAPQSGVYVAQISCTFSNSLNVSLLKKAWRLVIERHPVLRTSFHWERRDQPFQVVYRSVNLPWEQYDWRGVSSTEQQELLKNFLKGDRQRDFDINKPPLMRLTLIQLAKDNYQFVWSKHHLILDGWSTAIVFKDVFDTYSALHQGQDLPSLPSRPYGNYIAWLRQQDLSQAEAFWRRTLKGFTTPTPLRVDRNSGGSHSGQEDQDEQQIQLSEATTSTLKALAQHYQLTLNTLVQGAFALLLSRYSGEEDILFGATSSGRPADLGGVENMVGVFINTLPVRVRVTPEDFLLPWLKKLQAQQIEARQYEYSPLVEVQAWSDVPRGMPLFESILVFENYPVDSSLAQHSENLDIREIRFVESINYPLTAVVGSGSELSLNIWYDCRRFEAATITRMLGHFQTLLEGMVANPDQRLKDLQLLTQAERHQLLVEWNGTQANYSQGQCIHQLFEAQVEQTPDAVAVVFEAEHLTYRELNVRANQLAHYLQKLGVGPEVLVGIYVERSLDLVVGILGILKAGGAYLPLDLAYPPERLAFILQDARMPILLTQQPLVKGLPEYQTQVVCLDTDWESISQESLENSISQSTDENLAYVIYTSGSTGQPKGVLVNHANVTRLFAATQSWFYFNQQDVWTLFHSIAFDFSVWELWGALLHSGKLVIVPYLVSRSPRDFYDLLCQEQVTVLNQTPSAFRQLMREVGGAEGAGEAGEAGGETCTTLDGNLVSASTDDKAAGRPAKNLCLRLVIFGGEALEPQSLKPWFDRHGDKFPQLVNMYGITETTVHVTYRPLTAADTNRMGSVIGRPIPDLNIYLLDKHFSPLPIGVPGELYVSGAGVARGYLNRPELTTERFISNPFSTNPSERLYKSGDLARYLPNGEIEYLGRIDDQVKIRGFRIELGEIEAVLGQYSGVRETVVLVREDRPGDKQLVAYIVPNSEQVATNSELRNYLKGKLPDYMVPSAFVMVEALPLTPNGKVDRRALPAPNTARPELDEAFVAPRTPEEKVLADIWVQVLGVEQIGIHDNFFALGGDSIRSIQVLTKTQERGLSCSLQQIFQYQTIHQLARELTTAKVNTNTTEQVQLFSLICEEDRRRLSDGVEDAYPLTMLQAGMLFHSEYSSNTQIYHYVSSFYLKAPFDFHKLHTALQQLASRHPVLRTSFDLSNFSEPLQLVHKSVSVPFQAEDLRHLSPVEQEATLAAWFETEKSHKFDWTSAPLLRFQIHRRSEETFQFSFTEHHAILDGWSVASMLTELFEHYFFLLGKKVSPIQPSQANAFRNFVALQKKALKSEECQRYWIQKLNDSPMTVLPRGSVSQQPTDDTSEVRVVNVPINPEVSQGLKKLAQSAKVPLKSVLFAAHLKVVSQLCSQLEVVTLISSNGRPETTDGTRSLGLFLNPLPFRMKLPRGTWIDLIRQAFQTEQELLPFRWYPMAQIQKDLGGQRRFETCFNFTHFHVYQRIETSNDFQVLGGRGFNITNFVLLAEFSLKVSSSEIQLFLCCDTSELCSQQIEKICHNYAQILTAIAKDPTGYYENLEDESNKQKIIKEQQIKDIGKASLQKLKIAKRKTFRSL